ncbi:acyl carrier protein [bacterium]|nr:acyl carrier protein [bacterium]
MKQEEALLWIAEIFEEPIENVKPETLREAIPGFDSMGVLALMAALDQDFDIVLNEEDIRTIIKVGDILQILERNGKLESGAA